MARFIQLSDRFLNEDHIVQARTEGADSVRIYLSVPHSQDEEGRPRYALIFRGEDAAVLNKWLQATAEQPG